MLRQQVFDFKGQNLCSYRKLLFVSYQVSLSMCFMNLMQKLLTRVNLLLLLINFHLNKNDYFVGQQSQIIF